MALELRQQLKLSQQLVMTPQLQQAIKLLQLSRMELVDLVQTELEENPLLEEGNEVPEERVDTPEGGEDVNAPGEEIAEVVGESEGLNDIDWQTYLEGYSLSGPSGDNFADDDERPAYENLITKKQSLADHLMWQLKLTRLDDLTFRVAAEIIGNLDDQGYLRAGLDEIATITKTSPENVEKILGFVQQFDPPGVAARDLQECLLCQAINLGMEGTLVEAMLREHMDDLENRRYARIAKEQNVTLDDVLVAAKIISDLEPRPGRPFSQEDVHYITADIFVHKIGDEYVVVLNDDGLPNLKISSFYRQALSNDGAVDQKASEYIQDKMRGAVWLIKSIHQRQRTIYRVTKSIIKFQRMFFDHGIEHLKPLVLRDVAEDIQMHESTISRVTTNKYVQTPQGLFELKYFFNSAIGTVGGSAVASESVKNRIKDIVAGENPKKPYSDQKIVELLREHGIDIARRTVTKYREMLNIGSSTGRKRMF
ncbi:MAG: RNA polymerase factor sigma-54 [Desulfuromonadales bacterium]|nr:RNA polymerase factor sigma-54 [Desulfuromonadales bacterium]